MLSASCLGLGCLSDPAPRTHESIELFSWWISTSEKEALDALLHIHAEEHPNTVVRNAAATYSAKARDILVARMSNNLPPDAFQANIGRNLSSWVFFNQHDTGENKLESLNELSKDHKWHRAFSAPLIELLSADGELYGVPVNIHRINSLFLNKHIFEELNLPRPDTLDELHEVLEQLVAAGFEHPLSIGSKSLWPVSTLTLENILPAVAGAGFYGAYWRGQLKPEAPPMVEAIEELLYLWPFFNPDASELTWSEGVERLFASEDAAAMTIMGDWAKGHLASLGYIPGEDFEQIPFPGTSGTFVFTADCFSIPKGATNSEAAKELLVTFGSKRGQLAFSKEKGSIPARSDIDTAKLDIVARQTWRSFNEDTLLLALSGLVQPDYMPVLHEGLNATLKTNDPDPALFALRNLYAELAQLPQE